MTEAVCAPVGPQGATEVQPPSPDSYAGLRAAYAASEKARVALLSQHRMVRAERDRLRLEVERLTALLGEPS